MGDAIVIRNDGPRIVESNYWESDFARDGLLFLSPLQRTFRLLVPASQEQVIAEMRTAKLVIAQRPRNPDRFAFSLLFDDGSENPFFVDFSAGQLSTVPDREDEGRTDLEFTAWTQPRRGVPHDALRRPAAYRSVPRLPWLKPWDEK